VAAPLDAETLRGLLQIEVQAPLRRLQGRETFLHRAADGRALVVKRSGPGVRPAGWREHDALERLARDGLPVPAALGWAASDAGSVVVLERVPHKESARDALARLPATGRRALLARVARLAAELHRKGWHHRDLYLQHVLLRDPDGALVLIDVGRARRAPPPRARWFVKDLAALLHSLPAAVLPRERLRFVLDYLDGRDLRASAARRRWVRAAFGKQRRMAAHVPRDERAGAR
jgi:tRNA A-37 threonylcarbamoyl transferase component Bud32